MKSLSTAARTYRYTQLVRGNNAYSHIKAVYVDNGTDVLFDDLTYPVTITKDIVKRDVGNLNLTPAVSVCEFAALNKDGKYSPKNAGSAFSDILVRDRVFKFYEGKNLGAGTRTTAAYDSTFTYYTAEESSGFAFDGTNAGGNSDAYNLISGAVYGTSVYGTSTYGSAGYVVFVFDRETAYTETLDSIVVTATGTEGAIYYRNAQSIEAAQAGDITSWTAGGATVSGTKTVALGSIDNWRYLLVAVMFDVDSYDSTFAVSDCTLTYTPYVEWILLGTFFLDEPDFQEGGKRGFRQGSDVDVPIVSLVATDVYKRAVDTEINLQDLSSSGGGVAIRTLIMDIADIANIPYNSSDIAVIDTGKYPARTIASGYTEAVTVDDIYNNIMQIIGTDYRMWIDETGYLHLSEKSTSTSSDWIFDYRNYINAVQTVYSDRRVKRITFTNEALSAELPVDPEVLLDEAVGATASTVVLDWSGVGNAAYLRYTFDINSGDAAITGITWTRTGATFTLSGSSIDVTIRVYGCPYTGGAIVGEQIDPTNAGENDGATRQLNNPLILTEAEAERMATDYLSLFAEVPYTVKVQDAYANGLLELADTALLVSSTFFETTIYEVTSIKHIFASVVEKYTEYELSDSGRNSPELTYDTLFETTQFVYDAGYIYDGRYPVGTSYETISADYEDSAISF